MANNNINRSLNGHDPLSYLGINANGSYSASQTVTHARAPTINDSKNFILGCWWLVPSTVPLPGDNSRLFLLTALIGNDATWTEFIKSSANGIVSVLGVSPILVSTVAQVATVSLLNGANGQVLIGGGAGPVWNNITSSGTVVITNGPNSINLEVAGSAPVGAAVAFGAATTAVTPNAVGGATTQYQPIYDLTYYNIGAGYDNTTGIFTAPIAGIYHFDAQAHLSNLDATVTEAYISLQYNGGSGAFGELYGPYTIRVPVGPDTTPNSVIQVLSEDFEMSIGSTMNVLIQVISATTTIAVGGNGTMTFNGHLIGGTTAPTIYQADDAGTASPAAGILNVFGGTGISTTASGNTITINSTASSAFSASTNTLPQTNVTGDGTIYPVIFDLLTNEVGSSIGAYNPATGIFTIPETGVWQFNSTVQFGSLTSAHTNGLIAVTLGGVPAFSGTQLNVGAVRDTNNDVGLTVSTISVFEPAGTLVNITALVEGVGKTVSVGSITRRSYFNGFLVK